MSGIDIDSLFTPPTSDEIFEKFLQMLEDAEIPARSWRKRNVARTILRIVALLFYGWLLFVSLIAKSGFRTTAAGGWLDVHSQEVYDNERIQKIAATGLVTLTNEGGGVFTIDPGGWTFVNEESGKSYTNTEALSLGSGSEEEPTILEGVPVECTELGTIGNAAPGEINKLGTPETGVSVTNPAAVIGQDEESDADLAQRDDDKIASLSAFGPTGAYRFAIGEAKRLDNVNVNRISISPYSSTGIVRIRVASPSGPVSDEDLEKIAERIEDLARVATDTVDLDSATVVSNTKTITVWAKKTRGIDADIVEGAVERALEQFTLNYPIGGIVKPGETEGKMFAGSIEEFAKASYDGITEADKAALATVFLVECEGDDIALGFDEVTDLAVDINVRVVVVT